MVTGLKSNGLGLKYLALSVCANALIASAINPEEMKKAAPGDLMLKVNLVALAAPAPVQQAPVQQTKRTPTPAIPQNLVTDAPAVKTVSLAPEKKPAVERREKEKVATLSPVRATSDKRGKQKSSVVHEAKYRRQTPPSYPRRAVELRQEGTVVLHVEVLSSGLPRAMKVAQSSGYRLLDTAALTAVKKWEFEPTSVDGVEVAAWVRVPVRFVIR